MGLVNSCCKADGQKEKEEVIDISFSPSPHQQRQEDQPLGEVEHKPREEAQKERDEYANKTDGEYKEWFHQSNGDLSVPGNAPNERLSYARPTTRENGTHYGELERPTKNWFQ